MQFGVKGQGFVWAYRLNTGSKPSSRHDLSPEFLTQGYLQPVRKIARKPQNLDPNDPKPMTDRTRFHLSDLRLEPRSVSATKAHPKTQRLWETRWGASSGAMFRRHTGLPAFPTSSRAVLAESPSCQPACSSFREDLQCCRGPDADFTWFLQLIKLAIHRP